LKLAQEIMSSTASNYDVKKLFIGAGFAALSLISATLAAGTTIFASLKVCYPIIAIGWLYGIMMFASSYVEEEQHFWYWATTGWLTLLWIRSYVFLFDP
jgi:ethanolaminephosphotransferase